MKRIIALVLLIIIPIGLVISETNKKPLLQQIEKEDYSKQPKDTLWEYVKQEVASKRIDLNVNYREKYQDPILFTINNATAKDSIAIQGVIKELQTIFPLKKVAYFEDYIGEDFKTFFLNNQKQLYGNKKRHQYFFKNYDDITSYTTHLNFQKVLSPGTTSSAFNIEKMGVKNVQFRTGNWNTYFIRTDMIFDFKEDITVEERKEFLSEMFLRMYWNAHDTELINTEVGYRKEQKLSYQYFKNFHTKDVVNHIYVNDQFLLTKIFSDSFEEQLTNYMNKTYPWRYTNVFINKEEAKQNATVLVAFLGLLIIILSCSLFWNRKKEYTFLNYFFPILIYAIGIFSLNKLYAYLIYINQPTNSIGSILYSLLFGILTAFIASFLLWQIEKRISKNNGELGYQLIIKLSLTFVFLFTPYLIVYIIGDKLTDGKVLQTMNNLQFLFLAISLTFARGLLIYLNHFSENLIKQKDVELSQLKEINSQAEVKLLQSQINPHFLYNALNSIASLAHKNADKTEKMALSLSDLFKYTINRKGKKDSTIGDEVEMVKNYLEVEQIRFDDRLHFTIDVDKSLENVKIPMFLIQPLIENAVKHGISKVEKNGQITLCIQRTETGFLIIVEDNGPDFPDGLVSGYGLQTVFDLLRLTYKEKASISWKNTPTKNIKINIENEQ